MKVNQHIKRIFFICLGVVAGVGAMALLIAAIRIKREKVCKGYVIHIDTMEKGNGFLEKKNVETLLTKNGKETLTGKTTRTIELQDLEARLERHKWIKDAELFFDNNQVLQVKITERKPVARIFTESGNSFYIDSSCERLPLSDRMSARLPVFTGFPSDKALLKPVDKSLLKEIRNVSDYILKHPFWTAQISQVDITERRTFEMIPTIGKHVIEFGDGSNCEQKFDRLFLFYRQVLSKTGMEKYARINVKYEKQVIGVRNTYLSKMDSIKFVKNIAYLIASSAKADSVRKDSPVLARTQNSESGIQKARDERADSSWKLVKQ